MNLFIFFIMLFLPILTLSQEETNIVVPLESTLSQENRTAQSYRPGLNFQSTDVNIKNSPANLINSAAINIETVNIGRIGAIRIDGAATPPILGIDGFIIKDPGINQGQFILDLLPYDFAHRVDIYKQNMVPFGVNAGSFIDFRIPITFQNYTTVNLQASTTANLYTKVQGEQTFQDGSTFFGVLGDIGFQDYYYAINNGADFEVYPNSTYERFSFISKTVWKGLEFLIANTYTESFTETTGDPRFPISQITRNNLITGIRYQQEIFFVSANYTFYNQFVQAPSSTNDYLNHQLNIQTGVKDYIDRYYYHISVGYEFNQINDGVRASKENYKGVPEYGEHFAHLVTEFGVSLYKEEDNPTINFDFNIALNQIISQNNYTPVPSFTIGLRHKNGTYASAHISRVYVLPDLTTAYGLGTSSPLLSPRVKPKDGVRSGLEVGVNKANGRVFANASYSWLDRGFRLTEADTVVNSDDVKAISVEIGGEYKYFINQTIIEVYTGLAWTEEKDNRGISPTPIPKWKWVAQFTARDIDNTWNTTLTYRLLSDVPNGGGFVDNIPRHYLDLNLRYKIFTINILNLANQSYRPIPNNLASPYNPGIRAEFGIEYRF